MIFYLRTQEAGGRRNKYLLSSSTFLYYPTGTPHWTKPNQKPKGTEHNDVVPRGQPPQAESQWRKVESVYGGANERYLALD